MRYLPQKLFTAWFYLVFAFFLLLIYPYLYFAIRNPDNHAAIHRLRSWGCRQVCRLSGLRLSANLDMRHWQNPKIFISNHTSMLDIVVGLAMIRDQVHYVGKAELEKIPLVGIFFKYMDIPVNRESYAGRKASMEQAADDLEKGIHIFLFPEGTTSLKSPELLNFKKGAFVLSKSQGVPVVPVTFVDNWHLFHYDFVKWRKPGKCRIEVQEEILPNDFETVDEMKAKAFELMEESLKKFE